MKKQIKYLTLILLLINSFLFSQVIEHTGKVEISTVDELTPIENDTKVAVFDGASNEIKYVEASSLNSGGGVENYSFKDALTGLPNTGTTTDATREGIIGLNEPNPEEQLDMVGDSSTGGFKSQYTYDDGTIVRSQFGGENILSELGVPSGTIKGFAIDMTNIYGYNNTRSYIFGGNFSQITGGMNLQGGAGISALSGTDFASRINFEPIIEDSIDDWRGKFQTYNVNNDYVDLMIGTKGVGSNYLNEAQAKFQVYNDEGDNSTFIISPHILTYNNLITLNGYANNTVFKEGYVHTDDVSKTGTASSTIGKASYSLSVDDVGHVMATPVTYHKTITIVPSELYNSNTTPIVLIPSQGENTLISVDRAYVDYSNSSLIFNCSASLYLTFSDYSNAISETGNILTQGSDYIDMFKEEGGRNPLLKNSPLYLTIQTDGTQGDADIKIHISYTIITTN